MVEKDSENSSREILALSCLGVVWEYYHGHLLSKPRRVTQIFRNLRDTCIIKRKGFDTLSSRFLKQKTTGYLYQ